MKKNIIYLLFIPIIILSSCSVIEREPVFYEKYKFSNENASLYVLNLTNKDIFIFLEKNDGNNEQKIIEPSNLSKEENDKIANEYLSKNRVVSLTYSNIQREDSLDNSEWTSIPFNVNDKEVLCSDFSNSGITNISIQDTDNNNLYTSKIVQSKEDSVIILKKPSLGSKAPYEIEKNFYNGDFLFATLPGDYLFIDCDVEAKEMIGDYYGEIKNPRYIIIILEKVE